MRALVLIGCVVLMAQSARPPEFRAEAAPPAGSGSPAVPLPMVSGPAIARYPPIALTAKIEGTVVLHVTTNGENVAGVETTRSINLLNDAAVRLVRQWTFDAHDPVAFDTRVEFSFIDDCAPITTLEADIEAPVSVHVSQPGGCLIDPRAPRRLTVSPNLRGRLECECRGHFPLPGATIELVGVGRERTVAAQTDADGNFMLIRVPSGDYRWRVDAPGFSPDVIPGDLILVRRNGRAAEMGTFRLFPDSLYVSQARFPSYPASAVARNIQGRVRIQVDRTGSASILDGDPVLASSALANVLSWKITRGSGTAVVTYTYSLIDDCANPNPHVTMKLPFEVTVVGKRRAGCGP